MRADVAILGYGHVGRRFAALLEERRALLDAEHDLSVRVVGTATRRSGPPAGELVRRLHRSDAPIRVLVETTTLNIADGEPAISHVKAALAAGCHVITANKGPVAFAYSGLRAAADAAGLSFLFEGAVMDGIPVFNLVRETMPAVQILGFRGIVNTTTNVILSALEDGEPFGPALARMQAEGIAEADASLDLEGWDAAAKTAALANVLMNAGMTPHDVERRGIDEHTAADARAAKAAGRRLRLVAQATRLGEHVDASVNLAALEAADLLAGIGGTANALVLRTDLLGELAVLQLSGDLTQTAYALLSDLVTIRRRQARPARPRPRSLSPLDRR